MYLDHLKNAAKQEFRHDYRDRWREPEHRKNKLIFGAQNFSIKPLSDPLPNRIYLDLFVSKSSLSAL